MLIVLFFGHNISDYYSTVFARILVFKTVEKLISELPSKTQIKSFEENSIDSDLTSIIYFQSFFAVVFLILSSFSLKSRNINPEIFKAIKFCDID